MQDLADKFKRRVIRVFGIAGHGKGEVDHVGGVAKVAVRQEVARGELFTVASEVHDFLNNKFGEKEHPPYHLYQVNTDELETECKASAKIVYKTIPGSSSFHVIIFKPEAKVFKAASRLCLCESYQIDYGSCSCLRSQVVYPASLRSGILPPIQHNNILEEIDDNNMAEVFIVPDTVVAVAAAPESVDTIWLIHVNTTNCISFKEENVDDYQHVIPPGINFNNGNYYERSSTNRWYNLSPLKRVHSFIMKLLSSHMLNCKLVRRDSFLVMAITWIYCAIWSKQDLLICKHFSFLELLVIP